MIKRKEKINSCRALAAHIYNREISMGGFAPANGLFIIANYVICE